MGEKNLYDRFVERGKREVMENAVKEDLEKEIEKSGLKCDCGEKVREVGTGAIQHQASYNECMNT